MGVDGRAAERNEERLSEKRDSVSESLSDVSRREVSSVFLRWASRSISAATWALMSAVTRTHAKLRSWVTQPPRISQARISMYDSRCSFVGMNVR